MLKVIRVLSTTSAPELHAYGKALDLRGTLYKSVFALETRGPFHIVENFMSFPLIYTA